MKQALPPPAANAGSVLRIVGWNAALVLVGLALIAIAGEAWLRATTPFIEPARPSRFVPGVGVLLQPDAEIRHTNDLDYWTVSRTNSLGFPDREPLAPERAAASCHVAVIGDSVVAGLETPLAGRVQVRLEALAARELPELDVTVSAFGRHETAQANQLPFYDEYARRLRPNLVVLVFFTNDFDGNHPALLALREGWDPNRLPYAFPVRADDGGVELRPPDPDYAADTLPWFAHRGLGEPSQGGWRESALRGITERSLFARWLNAKRRALFPGAEPVARPPMAARAEALSRRPGQAGLTDGWEPTTNTAMRSLLLSEDPPPVFAEAREFTAWALAEFQRRADRDGASLVVLSASGVGDPDSRKSVILRDMTDELGIAVVSHHDWIVRSGGRAGDAHWPHDFHWSPQGHRWAAEAILDWLRRHPEVCVSHATTRDVASEPGAKWAGSGSDPPDRGVPLRDPGRLQLARRRGRASCRPRATRWRAMAS